MVSFLLLTAGLARIPSTDASVISTVEPAVAVVLGAALLDRPVGIGQVLGVVTGSVAGLLRLASGTDLVVPTLEH